MKKQPITYYTLALSAILCLTSTLSNAVTFKEIKTIIYNDSLNKENKLSEIRDKTDDKLALLKDLSDTDGSTILHHAALKGLKTLVENLIEEGVDVDVTDKKDKNALHYIAIGYYESKDKNRDKLIYTEIAKLLLEKNIDFNKQANVTLKDNTYQGRNAFNIFSTVGLENINLLILEKQKQAAQATINNLAGSLSQLAKG